MSRLTGYEVKSVEREREIRNAGNIEGGYGRNAREVVDSPGMEGRSGLYSRYEEGVSSTGTLGSE